MVVTYVAKHYYRIAGNFRKPKFSENSFQWIFRKNIFEIFGYLWKIPEVSEISENKVLRKFPAIRYHSVDTVFTWLNAAVTVN